MSEKDDIQEMLMLQITSLKEQLEKEMKQHKSETDKLDKIIKAKNDELQKLEIKSTWEMAEDNSSMIKDQLEATKKMNEAFQLDIQNKTKEINNFRKEITDLKDEISKLTGTLTLIETSLHTSKEICFNVIGLYMILILGKE